jgi:energy-coupling factor transport system ATP-binding protein
MEEMAISIKKLSYAYPGSDAPVLRDVSLEIPQGSFFVITGQSGSGKSTLLMLLRGFSQEIGGKLTGGLRVGGLDAAQTPIAGLGSAVGIVFQNPGLQLHQLRVVDEIISAGMYRGLPYKKCEHKARKLIKEIVGEELKNKSPEELSGGQKQKVALAATLMFDAPILLLDEPFSFLDGKTKQEFLNILIRMNRQGKTVIIATHDVELVAPLATAMAIMYSGRIVKVGSAVEVVYSREMEQTVGTPLFARLDGGDKKPLSWNNLFLDEKMKQNIRGKIDRTKSNNNKIALSLDSISFSYSRSVVGLKNVTCNFKEGEIFGLIGANGSGKSTLAKIIAGLLKLKDGNIEFRGKNINNLPMEKRARHIGYSTQDPLDMFFESTILAEVSAGPKFLHLDNIKEKAENTLREFSLWQYKNRHPDSISGGEKKRLGIADIIVNGVDVLLLDEPEFGLDAKNWGIVCDYLRSLVKFGKTIIIITQDLEMAYFLCDRVGVLARGELVAVGLPDKIFKNQALLEKFGLMAPGIANLPDL